MEHAITFDTLACAKKLESSGLQPKQAESIAEAMKDVLDENIHPLVFTKKDAELLESKLETRFAQLKSELIVWMISLLFAQSAFILTMIKFLH